MSGPNNERWRFRRETKDDVARHLSRPEYTILRPAEFRGDLRGGIQGPNHTVSASMEGSLSQLVYRSSSFNTNLHIGDCPCGELMEHVRGIDMRYNNPVRNVRYVLWNR